MHLSTGRRTITQTEPFQSKVPKQYANGYDVQIAKKIAEAQGKKPLGSQKQLGQV